MKTKKYKGYLFKFMYRQWVNDEVGAFWTWNEVKTYVDNVYLKKLRKLRLDKNI